MVRRFIRSKATVAIDVSAIRMPGARSSYLDMAAQTILGHKKSERIGCVWRSL